MKRRSFLSMLGLAPLAALFRPADEAAEPLPEVSEQMEWSPWASGFEPENAWMYIGSGKHADHPDNILLRYDWYERTPPCTGHEYSGDGQDR